MPTVSLVNMKGGVAKTTLAINLADVLARREECSVLLVDLDPQFNATQCLVSGEDYVAKRENGEHTIVQVFDDAPAPLVNVVTGSVETEPTNLSDIKPWRIRKNFFLLPGDLELYRLEMVAGQGREHRLKRFLDAVDAQNTYDFVIIDTPPTPSAWMMSALIASEYYVVPVKPEPLSTVGIDLLRGIIKRCSTNFAHPIECLGVVLTIAEEQTIVFRNAKEFLDNNPVWEGKRFQTSLPKRTAIARAQGEQQLILDLNDSKAKTAITSITREFLEKISNE